MIFNANYIVYVQSLNSEKMGKAVINLGKGSDGLEVLQQRMVEAMRAALVDLAICDIKDKGEQC